MTPEPTAEPTYKERTRARILDEAARALREAGTEGVGVAALMKRAGLTHGAFYAHFASRDDLVLHAVERMFEDSRRMLARHLTHEDAAEGLRGLIDHYLSDALRRAPDRGCPLPGLSGEARRLPPAARERFTRGVDAFREALRRSLHALGVEDPDATASSVLAEMVGAMALARAAESDEHGARVLQASRTQLRRRLRLQASKPPAS